MMANSEFISFAKNKILSDLQNDALFLQVLGVTDEEIDEGLVWTRLFPCDYIYDGTQTMVKTYVCIEVDIKSTGNTGLYGYGNLILINNNHGSYDKTYRYRQLIFRGIDMNDNLCG